MEEWELQPAWLDSSSSSGDACESNKEDNSSDSSSDSPEGGDDVPQSGAPSRPSELEASTIDKQSGGVGTDEGQKQTDELLHLDSGEGESGAESEPQGPTGNSAEETRQASAETGADADDLDSISDATDCSDIFHIQELPEGSHDSGMRSWETYEDRVQSTIDRLAARMREYPLMPPDFSDPTGEETYRDMGSCVRLPLLHCAFKGCTCDVSRNIYCSKLYHWQLEIEIYEHIVEKHLMDEKAADVM